MIQPLETFSEFPSDLKNKTNEDIVWAIYYLTEKVNEIIEVLNKKEVKEYK